METYPIPGLLTVEIRRVTTYGFSALRNWLGLASWEQGSILSIDIIDSSYCLPRFIRTVLIIDGQTHQASDSTASFLQLMTYLLSLLNGGKRLVLRSISTAKEPQ